MDRRHHPLFPESMKRRLLASLMGVGLLASACSSSNSETAGDSTDATPITSSTSAPSGTTAPSETTETNQADEAPEQPNTLEPGDASTFFPDVLDATAMQAADGTWTFAVTLSSPYDTPQQYADAWRVVGPDGSELGFRFLTHDHANEQPFTRSQSGIEIPDGVTTVTIEARDQVNGWGGTFLDFVLPA